MLSYKYIPLLRKIYIDVFAIIICVHVSTDIVYMCVCVKMWHMVQYNGKYNY